MTSTRKQLVEKAAKAILDANDVQPDDPDGDHGYYMQTWKYAVQDAEAALAVFEAASLSVSDGSVTDTDPDHSELLANVASSDDEREALLRTIINAPESGDALHVAEAKRVRDAVLAAGFHRTVQGATEAPNSESFGSVQGEPSQDREAQALQEAELYVEHTVPSQRAEVMDDFMTGWRTADRTPRQGEPTDAQVLAAQSALLSDIGWVRYSYVRNALRAAAQAHQEG